MGMELEWNELPEKKASRIIASIDADFDNKEAWSSQFDWTIEAAVKMKKAIKNYL